jgi:hypothetical protein
MTIAELDAAAGVAVQVEDIPAPPMVYEVGVADAPNISPLLAGVIVIVPEVARAPEEPNVRPNVIVFGVTPAVKVLGAAD